MPFVVISNWLGCLLEPLNNTPTKLLDGVDFQIIFRIIFFAKWLINQGSHPLRALMTLKYWVYIQQNGMIERRNRYGSFF